MTKKERVILSLQHRQPDITPYEIGFTAPVREKLIQHYGDTDLDRLIGNHFCKVNAGFPWRETRPGFWQDSFGVVWDRTIDEDIGNPADCVLAEKGDLDRYRFPEITPELFSAVPKTLSDNPDRFGVFSIGFSLFERAWTLRGMENLLTDMITDPIFVDTLLDRILEFNLRLIDRALQFPVQMFHFGDDYGQQRGLITGPRFWRRFFKPRLAQMYGKAKARNLFVSIHSCGDIEEILPDLIELGVDLYNPFQPEVTDIYRIKKEYGSRLSFWGGLSTQKVLPFGTPDDVRKEVRKLIKEIGHDGGYVLAPAHATPKDVPLENILALLETVRNQ